MWLCGLLRCRKGENVEELLNDKRHIEEQRARYQAYETVVDEIVINPGESADTYGLDDYDDEYDDTYDMNQVGANDLDGDSLLNRRWVVEKQPQKNRKLKKKQKTLFILSGWCTAGVLNSFSPGDTSAVLFP